MYNHSMKQSSNPKVSVLMSAYNCAEYLGEAIESILNQTFNDYEFIIINNASPDNCIDIIRHYAKLDTRIRVINNVKNISFGAVQQQLFEEAKGEYLAFAHGDDIYKPERLAKQVEYLDIHPNIGLLSANYYAFGRMEGDVIKLYNDHDIKSHLLWRTAMLISSTILRRSLVETDGLRMMSHLKATADFQFFVDAAGITELAIHPDILSGWRTHDKQGSVTLDKTMIQEHCDVVRSHLNKFGIKTDRNTIAIFSFPHDYNRLNFRESLRFYKLILSIASIKDFYGYSGVSDRFISFYKKRSKKMCPRYIYEFMKFILLLRKAIK